MYFGSNYVTSFSANLLQDSKFTALPQTPPHNKESRNFSYISGVITGTSGDPIQSTLRTIPLQLCYLQARRRNRTIGVKK
jgi:hypothetical protein